ncbi:succinate dehydrogenase assembly factor 2 [methane-oxidizing endosymbiont of Gigantopelta aegis]|uniref:FAD assembly factor SdhE n=1 Tax=methane-oxidizing endosymbiont of Gigantopelta aegis TaxID=2794938 RepID=UPI0018DBCE40|nr:succinate dehydrogenase assembly factor 2 [methane-oxidizing endosymbiont of Gigantopelta aegis]
MDADLNRLRWRCRRGTLELDVIFRRFLEQKFSQATTEEQQAFIRLLALEDNTLLHYFMEEQEPDDAALKALVAKMRLD